MWSGRWSTWNKRLEKEQLLHLCYLQRIYNTHVTCMYSSIGPNSLRNTQVKSMTLFTIYLILGESAVGHLNVRLTVLRLAET